MTGNSSLAVRFVIFFVTFMHVSNVTNYVQSLRIGSLVQWNFWMIGIAICALVALFSGAMFRITRAPAGYFIWSGVFIATLFFSLLFVNQGQIAQEGAVAYLWFFGTGLSLALLIRTPSDVRACGYGVVVAVLLLVILTIMEFLNPDFQVLVDRLVEDINQVGVINRAGALYENPNDNGTAMVLAMFIGQFFLPKQIRLIFFLLVGAAVFCTVSRGSLTIWAVAVVLSLLLGFGAKSRVVGFLGVIFMAALGYFLVAGQIPEILAGLGMDQFLSGAMTERLSQNFFTQQDGSTEGRLEAAEAAFQTFISNPFVGIGIGESDSLGPFTIGTHNQHLKIASELGLVGLIVYAGLFVVALRQRSLIAFIFLLLYGMIGFTNHSMMTYTVFSILLPMALVFIPELQRTESLQARAQQKRRRRRRRRTASRAEQSLSA